MKFLFTKHPTWAEAFGTDDMFIILPKVLKNLLWYIFVGFCFQQHYYKHNPLEDLNLPQYTNVVLAEQDITKQLERRAFKYHSAGAARVAFWPLYLVEGAAKVIVNADKYMPTVKIQSNED